ncbi:MAG: DNA mismatch repair protein MutS [Patescibacteria group bacterium]
MAELTPMLKQYYEIKEQYPTEILLFRLGDFYEMFGEDAVMASKILDIVLTARNRGTENEMSMCGVPYHAVDNYLAKLVKAGKRVAICDQMSDPELLGIVDRQVTRVVTPGTTFDELSISGKANNFVLSLYFQKGGWGVAIADVTTGDFRVFETADFNLLKNELARLSIAEVLIEADFFANPNWQKFLNELPNVHVFEYCDRLVDLKFLKNHFQCQNFDGFGLQKQPLALFAGERLIAYLKDTQKSDLAHITKIIRHNFEKFLTLDEATIRNLEIFYSANGFNPNGSLLSVIDATTTAMGGRLLRRFLLLPLKNIEQINERLAKVSFLKNKSPEARKLIEILKNVADLERLMGRIGCRRGSARDLSALKRSLQLIPKISQVLMSQDFPDFKKTQDNLQCPDELISLIEQVVVEEPPALLTEGGMVKDGYNIELDDWRKISRGGKDYLLDLQRREIDRTGINSLKVKFNNVFGYYIEISKANLAQAPDDYIRKQTLVNAERFITPELKEFEEKILQADEKIKKIEFDIIIDLLKKTTPYFLQIQKVAETVAELDVFVSLAQLANQNDYCCPQFNDGGYLKISAGRHPVIEKIIKENYTANDLEMAKETTDFILLTGPNMSGKSSFLRQNALICLLAHIGSFVPAKSAEICLLDRIFTRVGASDDLSRGISTFMAEMQEAANILHNATSNSFIILDELGRGTSTSDGLSIAQAIVEYLCKKIKAKTIFATHYHELTKTVVDLPMAVNYCVAVAEENNEVVFLHKIIKGATSKSYGLEVARMAGLPKELISRAEEILEELENKKNFQISSKQVVQAVLPLPAIKEKNEKFEKVIKEISALNPDELSPIEAWKKISIWKKNIQ